MSGHRLLVFARKPAPIQVTAWGEPTGTGLKTMDYLLADPVLIPMAERVLLAEQVIDLPNFLGFWAPQPLPAPGPLPALAQGYVTFGSFNRLDKIQDQVVRTWAKILNALPTARIVLKNRRFGDSSQRDRIAALFAEDGIARERLTFLPAATRLDHFSAYDGIDLALDTFPHGGGMTTLDALWMGVPVVTCSRSHHLFATCRCQPDCGRAHRFYCTGPSKLCRSRHREGDRSARPSPTFVRPCEQALQAPPSAILPAIRVRLRRPSARCGSAGARAD